MCPCGVLGQVVAQGYISPAGFVEEMPVGLAGERQQHSQVLAQDVLWACQNLHKW